MRRLLGVVFVLVCVLCCLRISAAPVAPVGMEEQVTQGALRVKAADGGVVECPLKHTDVKADISGFIAMATVTQTFVNPYDEKIEAVYVFPLPHTAAVVDMTMVVGTRRIIGVMKRREEARQAYELALQRGQTASLLEQERPNIFTQSVGNIKPHAEVRIEITYFDVLAYDNGVYEFHFPMVIGPRYMPGKATSAKPLVPAELQGKVGEDPQTTATGSPTGTGWSADTDRVPDASRISPPVLKPGQRTGHDISLSVKLDAGVPIQNLRVVNHQADIQRGDASQAAVTLSPADAIPNKDFVLRYFVKGNKPEMALLTHARGSGEGYFMLMMQPGIESKLSKEQSREITFVIDVSGSMQGEPTEKVKGVMREFFALSRTTDTVQVVTFSDTAAKLFDKPVPATKENVTKALDFTQLIQSGGGTEMLTGLNLALDEPQDPSRVRMVVLLTDGDIGNEAEVMKSVQTHTGDQLRVSVIGIGSAPNRFLIDGIARVGNGLSGVVELKTDPAPLVEQIVERLHRAQLANININWNGLSVSDVYPRRIPDLWFNRPVTLFGRFFEGGSARITVAGQVEGEQVSFTLPVDLPEQEMNNVALSPVWARKKIEDLFAQMYGGEVPEVVETITQLALKYRLMSQYTSFVAVDEQDIEALSEPAKPPRRMVVPVPLPEGMSYTGVFGGEADEFAIRGRTNDWNLVAGEMLAVDARDVDGTVHVVSGDTLTYCYDAVAVTSSPNTNGIAPTIINAPVTLSAVASGSATVNYRFKAMSSAQPVAKGKNVSAHAARANTAPAPPPPSARASQVISVPASKTPKLRVAITGGVRFPVSTVAGGKVVNGPAGPMGPQGPSGPPPPGIPAPSERLEARMTPAPVPSPFAGWGDTRREEAKLALADAQALRKENKLDDAVRRAQHAYLLELAYRNFHPGNVDGTQAAILQLLQETGAARTAERVKTTPMLAKKLDLVVRDQSLQDAIPAVAAAAGLTIDVLPSSLLDAAALTGVPELRVTYLDLRRATVAQALDWLLLPSQLIWYVNGPDKITVASTRRLPDDSAWVYDIGALVTPLAEEVKDSNGVTLQKQALTDLVVGARLLTGQKDEKGLAAGSVVLLSPNYLLVYGSNETHRRVNALLETLKTQEEEVTDLFTDQSTGEQKALLEKLDADCSKRWAARAEMRKQQWLNGERRQIQGILVMAPWPLLAGAGQGTADETITALQAAWRNAQFAEAIKGNHWAAMRAAWAITQAQREDAGISELTVLTAQALSTVQQGIDADITAVQQQPQDQAAYLSLLYAVLAMRNGAALGQPTVVEAETQAKAEKLLTAPVKNSPFVALRTVAISLLAPTPETDAELKSLIQSHLLTGNDLVVLAQRAANQRGATLQRLYREELPTLTAGQPLSGHVVVYVNR